MLESTLAEDSGVLVFSKGFQPQSLALKGQGPAMIRRWMVPEADTYE